MHQFGMEQYALDDKVMTADMLVSMFDDRAENLDEVGSAALVTSKKYAETITTQMKTLLMQ